MYRLNMLDGSSALTGYGIECVIVKGDDPIPTHNDPVMAFWDEEVAKLMVALLNKPVFGEIIEVMAATAGSSDYAMECAVELARGTRRSHILTAALACRRLEHEEGTR